MKIINDDNKRCGMPTKYLNVLVSMEYDNPDNGLCIKLRVIKGCSRLNFQKPYIAALKMHIFQQSLFPSDMSAYGCMVTTYAREIHGLINAGNSFILAWSAAYRSLRFCATVSAFTPILKFNLP